MFDPTDATHYTVGWICALPVPEWQASRMLLDEGPTLSNATFQYVYGRIHGHYVVMGCLPDSEMGMTSFPAPREILNTLPYDRDDGFVGRQTEIDDIESCLFIPGRHTRLALEGLGGIGKSQIAIEYAYRLKVQHPDVHIFWVHASTYQRFANDYSALVSLLHMPGADDPIANQVQLVANWLSSPVSGQWLLILDNADDDRIFGHHTRSSSNETSNTMLTYIPQKVDCAVLITSRVFPAAMTLVGNDVSRVMSIKALSTHDAAQLVHGKAPPDRECTFNEACQLAEQLDCIPLAITQAMAYINRHRLASVPTYISNLKGDATRLLSEEHHDLRRTFNEVPNSVLRTWAMSLRQIVADRPSAAELLYTLCLLDQDSIPVWRLAQQDFGLEDDLEILIGFSMLSLDVSKDTVHMHKLVQVASRLWAAKEPREGQSDWWLLEALRLLEQAYPKTSFTQENWPAHQLLDAHATAVWNHDLQDMPVPSRSCRASLRHYLAMYRNIRGNSEEAIALQKSAVDEMSDIYEEEDEDAIGAIHNLVQYYTEGGRYQEALRLGKDVLGRTTRVLGAEHPDTMALKLVLSRVHRKLGDLDKAADFTEDVLRVTRRDFGDEHIHTLNAMNARMLYLRDIGHFEAAREIGAEQLNKRRVVQGSSHLEALRATMNLAYILSGLARNVQAEILTTDCVLKGLQTLDHGDNFAVEGLDALADSLFYQERHLETELLLKACLSAGQSRDSREHSNSLVYFFDVASVLDQQGETKASTDIKNFLAVFYSMMYGQTNDHSVIALCLSADDLIRDGKSKEAVGLLQDIFEDLHAGSEDRLPCGILLANAKCNLGLHRAALTFLHQVLRERSVPNIVHCTYDPTAVLCVLAATRFKFSQALTEKLAADSLAAHRITNYRSQRNSWLYKNQDMQLIRPTRSYTKSLDIDPSEQEQPGIETAKAPKMPQRFRRWSVACGPMRPAEFGEPRPSRDYTKIKEKYKPELNKQQDQIFAFAEQLLKKYGPPKFPDGSGILPP